MEALNDFGLTDCKPMNTPAAPGTKFYKTVPTDDVSESGTFPYQSDVGILRRFSRTTHPQILKAVNQCAQHNVSPNNTHVTAVKRIFRYLQGTKAKGLIFRRGDGTLTLKAFCDADFGGEPEGNDQPMRSTTGLLVMQTSEVSLKVTINRCVQPLDYLYTFMVLVPCTGSLNFKQ